jgi:hypothetical protein
MTAPRSLYGVGQPAPQNFLSDSSGVGREEILIECFSESGRCSCVTPSRAETRDYACPGAIVIISPFISMACIVI